MIEDLVDDLEIWEDYKKQHNEAQTSREADLAWEAYKVAVQVKRQAAHRREIGPSINNVRKRLTRSLEPKSHATLDLHHMTQDQAYIALQHFLTASLRAGLKKVVVITGKGETDLETPWISKGVLKQVVPRWLQEMPFKPHIKHVEQAPRTQGGSGALVIHLNKR